MRKININFVSVTISINDENNFSWGYTILLKKKIIKNKYFQLKKSTNNIKSINYNSQTIK